MKPILTKDKKLTVELHKPDEAALTKARDVGLTLVAMHQDTGQALIDAIDAIMPPTEDGPKKPF